MPTEAHLTFPPFTSDTILFANKEAANAFFEAITVDSATPSTPGTMSQMEDLNVTYTPPAYDPDLYCFTINYIDAATELPASVFVATQATVDQLITNVAQLRATVLDLQAKMQASGQMAAS